MGFATVDIRRARVEERGWAPTILLCVVVILSVVIVVATKPLTAGASPARPHSHAIGAFGRRTAKAGRASQVPAGMTTSPNWSGYVVSPRSANDGSFNQVSARWIEPTVTCPKKNAWTLFWVGFDGWPSSDRSVEQGGTSAQCVNGVPRYSAFYEMWPTLAVTPMFAISAGDQITAGVVYSPDTQQFLITVTDDTTATSLTQTMSCPVGLACARISAEWVAESPSHFGTNKWFPLADYGTVDFTDATATDAQGISGPISDSQWVNSGIERVAGSATALAKVSGLQSAGCCSTFADTWVRKS